MAYQHIDEDLIIEYLPLVKNIVRKIEVRDNRLDYDDLVSIGTIGLMDAINRFDASKKVPFEAYASLRIKGTVMDELRKTGDVSRNRIAKLNEYNNMKEKLERELLRNPTEAEICQGLGIDEKELSKLHQTVHDLAGLSLESVILSQDTEGIELIDIIENEQVISPEDELVNKEMKAILGQSIDKLNDREQLILSLYYVEELTLTEIAYILEISVPRVSQIHGKILLKLKDNIRPQLEDR